MNKKVLMALVLGLATSMTCFGCKVIVHSDIPGDSILKLEYRIVKDDGSMVKDWTNFMTDKHQYTKTLECAKDEVIEFKCGSSIFRDKSKKSFHLNPYFCEGLVVWSKGAFYSDDHNETAEKSKE